MDAGSSCACTGAAFSRPARISNGNLMPDYNYLQDYKTLSIDFDEFRKNRDEYDTIIRRTRDHKLPADIAGSEKKVDVQTPDLEDALFSIAAIITTNPTYLDINVLSTVERF